MLRPAAYGNLFLPLVALSPAMSIGGFVDGFLQIIAGIAIGAASWTLIASASGSSYYAYGVFTFILLYTFNLCRAVYPRLFGVTYVAI